jgi:prepilin-type N-terminal cleavage/methylation domain-containing protein
VIDNRKTSAHDGFTFLELLCALVLSTLLLSSVLGLVGLLSRRTQALRADDTTQFWRHRFESQLRFDLGNARQFRQAPTELRILGFGSRDPLTDKATNRPVETSYTIETIGQEPWLIRRERQLDDITNREPKVAAICPGVKSIVVKLPEDTRPEPTRSGFIPKRMQIVFETSDSHSIEILFCR